LKTSRTLTRKAQHGHSRAALWTIQLAVDTLADSIRQLKAFRRPVHRGHRVALDTLRMTRHHTLHDGDLAVLEEGVGKLARRLDWPATMRSRTRHQHLERPLSDTESRTIATLAVSSVVIASGMLDIGDQLDAWYGGHAVSAATAARLALPNVTTEAHRKRAEKLMLRLDQLCANDHIAWAFAAGPEEQTPPLSPRTLH